MDYSLFQLRLKIQVDRDRDREIDGHGDVLQRPGFGARREVRGLRPRLDAGRLRAGRAERPRGPAPRRRADLDVLPRYAGRRRASKVHRVKKHFHLILLENMMKKVKQFGQLCKTWHISNTIVCEIIMCRIWQCCRELAKPWVNLQNIMAS